MNFDTTKNQEEFISRVDSVCKSLRSFEDECYIEDRLNEKLVPEFSKIGLLSPILARITENGKFEVVAGNRRFKACKSLGWKKIPCHIVELDDRHAFEASIIENIQRNTLNIIEGGLAFRKYINEFGWGAASELARKLSKSSSYVSSPWNLISSETNDIFRRVVYCSYVSLHSFLNQAHQQAFLFFGYSIALVTIIHMFYPLL
ncbi:MAG: ParB/RepB/Spo0J family partition protein [Nitrososphaeraceae archaeon]